MIRFERFLKDASCPTSSSVKLFFAKNKLRFRIAHSRPLRIVIGSGGVDQTGWISTDIDTVDLSKMSDWKRYFSKPSIDAILAEHVWEHLTREQGILAAKNCYDHIKVGGYLRVAVREGHHPNPEYISWVRPGGAGPGSMDHKTLYNYRSICEIFQLVGFSVCLLEYFDESGGFHFADWEPGDGMIYRSKRFDERNSEGILNYTSIILDARKTL